MIEAIRWILYGLIVFNVAYLNAWAAVGFGLTFLVLEAALHSITIIRLDLKELREEAETEKSETPNDFGMNFGYEFSSAALTSEESEYIEALQSGDGNIENVDKFLSSRCKDKTADFTNVPIPVKLLMSAKIMSLVSDDKTESEWADVITDESNKEN